MTKHRKAIERLLGKPRDFEWGDLKPLMEAFGYELKTTGGSGRKFIHSETGATLFMHEPHPAKVLKAYQINATINFLRQEKHIP